MKDYMKKPQGEIVTNRMHQLFDYYGRDLTLMVATGFQKNTELSRHLDNLALTYSSAYYEILETILTPRKVG